MKVERRVRKSLMAMLLSSKIGEEFAAMVTGASHKGTWVRLADPPVEGKLVRNFHDRDVGDPLHVRLVGVDVIRGHIDFEPA